ncbi:hypothetical protein ONZ45_g11588 [Pleurotus djamor]|nr:hypothetical protein ONZ45_g13612 [Pleurotus djamor]KAJ8502621.1 hypothetical protein ONZ45_g11588 [Pleurotus djamor]
MRPQSEEYLPLHADAEATFSDKIGLNDRSDETLREERVLQAESRLRRTRSRLWYIIIAQGCIIVGLFIVLMNHLGRPEDHYLYSPAEDAISYKYYTFFNGFTDDVSPFQVPPSPELDERWEDLYNFGISRIPKSQAAHLPNSTEVIPGDEDHYIVELDVFHELHCLNRIRKALFPAHYPDDTMDDPQIAEHISHCLDSVRQSLMCSSDVSTIVWKWDEKHHQAFPKGSVVHRCRDFDQIKEWALDRRTVEKYNTSRHVESDLPAPAILY